MDWTTDCGCKFEKGGWLIAVCDHGREFVQTGSPDDPLDEITEEPIIICLCGSTRFSEAYQEANLKETIAGNIVLTIGCDMRSDAELFFGKSPKELKATKEALDILHFRKIDLADEILILNVGGYIGESTRRELNYARRMGKKIRFLEGDHAEAK